MSCSCHITEHWASRHAVTGISACQSILQVFDGHNGRMAGELASNYMLSNLQRCLVSSQATSVEDALVSPNFGHLDFASCVGVTTGADELVHVCQPRRLCQPHEWQLAPSPDFLCSQLCVDCALHVYTANPCCRFRALLPLSCSCTSNTSRCLTLRLLAAPLLWQVRGRSCMGASAPQLPCMLMLAACLTIGGCTAGIPGG